MPARAGGCGDGGSHRVYARPSAVSVCAGSSGVTVRVAHTISLAPVTTTTPQLSHVYPRGTRVNERGHLELGGCDAVQLAREFGTPAYVVVEDDLRARARAFVDALAARHRDFDVLFASKAFPCTAVYRVLAAGGARLRRRLRRRAGAGARRRL